MEVRALESSTESLSWATSGATALTKSLDGSCGHLCQRGAQGPLVGGASGLLPGGCAYRGRSLFLLEDLLDRSALLLCLEHLLDLRLVEEQGGILRLYPGSVRWR